VNRRSHWPLGLEGEGGNVGCETAPALVGQKKVYPDPRRLPPQLPLDCRIAFRYLEARHFRIDDDSRIRDFGEQCAVWFGAAGGARIVVDHKQALMVSISRGNEIEQRPTHTSVRPA